MDHKILADGAPEEIDTNLYAAYVQKFKIEGKEEFDAQWAALEAIKENADISFKEVGTNE